MRQKLNSAEHCNAVVIGGGPAGSAAAIQLARAGKPACLLERKHSAHDKVCGEFISWEAAECLRQLGLDLPGLGAQPIRRMRFCNGEQELENSLPYTAWSLSRRVLDAALLEQAKQVGVDVRQGVTVREMIRDGAGWALGGLARNHCQAGAMTAGAVFLATGKHDLRNWRRHGPRQQQDLIGLKMHLYLEDAQHEALQETVEIHLFNGGYAGLEPVEQGKANLCFLISKDVYGACDKHWPDVFEWLVNASPHLRTRLSGALPAWQRPLAVYGVPYGYLYRPADVQPGLFRLGDQAAVIPSFAGDGIAIALRSACLAARVYAENGDAAVYQRRAQQTFQQPVSQARMLAWLFAHGAGRRAAFGLCRRWPALMKRMIHRTRIAHA